MIAARPDHDRALLPRSLLIGLGVFGLCLLGILSRPHFELATFWPANAFMLGMLVRFPHLAAASTWVSCAAGFFLADALTGSAPVTNLILNGSNLAAVAAGYALLGSLPRADRRLERPTSILLFLRAIIAASLVAGLTGIVANPLLFDGSWKEGFFFWASTELANHMAFLPVLLTLPPASKFRWPAVRRRIRETTLTGIMPLIALAASGAASVLIGGPGAVAFPVPALLWCALTYRLFTVSCLAFAFGAWTMQALHLGLIAIGSDFGSREMLISTRLGVTLMALSPIVVASVMAARNDLVERLRFLADRDALTGLRNRRAFFEDGNAMLASLTPPAGDPRPLAVMMIDIDHFKSINDTHGHEAGDRVLFHVARILDSNVRDGDIVGRIGGEEFAVMLPACELPEALSVAERIRGALRSSSSTSPEGRTIRATVSIGINYRSEACGINRLLARADEALYRAKEAGRDRFVLLSSDPSAADG